MRTFLLAAITTTVLILPAAAEVAEVRPFLFASQEVDTSFEASRARLEAQGYSEIEMIDGSAYRLGALDRDGAEVRLTINPQNGEVFPQDEGLEVATSPSG
jgi:hypothetical protein